jgi:hypothetical protein
MTFEVCCSYVRNLQPIEILLLQVKTFELPTCEVVVTDQPLKTITYFEAVETTLLIFLNNRIVVLLPWCNDFMQNFVWGSHFGPFKCKLDA